MLASACRAQPAPLIPRGASPTEAPIRGSSRHHRQLGPVASSAPPTIRTAPPTPWAHQPMGGPPNTARLPNGAQFSSGRFKPRSGRTGPLTRDSASSKAQARRSTMATTANAHRQLESSRIPVTTSRRVAKSSFFLKGEDPSVKLLSFFRERKGFL